jgi:hypothetical protein
LRELEAKAGRGITGGGALLPMNDVIRLASHAHHYLCIFDKGKAIALCHTKRLASPGQRIVLSAKDRGCSHPGCDVAGYWCEAHHCTPYAQCHTTDVNDLTFGCGGHHPLAEQGWTTAKTNVATPSGSHLHTWTTVALEPTRSITPRSCCARTTCPSSFGVKHHRACRIALFAGELWRAFGEGCRDPLGQIFGR